MVEVNGHFLTWNYEARLSYEQSLTKNVRSCNLKQTAIGLSISSIASVACLHVHRPNVNTRNTLHFTDKCSRISWTMVTIRNSIAWVHGIRIVFAKRSCTVEWSSNDKNADRLSRTRWNTPRDSHLRLTGDRFRSSYPCCAEDKVENSRDYKRSQYTIILVYGYFLCWWWGMLRANLSHNVSFVA